MNILLTGSRGMIGSYIKKNIQGNLVCPVRDHVLDHDEFYCDLTYSLNLKKVVRPNVIIHCAAEANPQYSQKTKLDLINNVLITYNLLEEFDNCHFINISTVLVHKDQETKDIGPSTVYGTGKMCCEHLCSNFEKIKNINVTNLRIPTTVGPKLTHGVLYDVINKIRDNNEITLLGKEPGSYRPFLHVSTLHGIIETVIEKKKYGTFTVGPEDNISVIEIANMVQSHLNKEVKIHWSGESWAGDNHYIKLKPEIATFSSFNAIMSAIKENV